MWALMILVNLKNKVSDPADIANRLLGNDKLSEISTVDLGNGEKSEEVPVGTEELAGEGQKELNSMVKYKKNRNFISLTVQEIGRFVNLIFSSLFIPTKEAFLSLCFWRRRHQAIAKDCHFKARGLH
jgi:hypothetical protein